MKTIPRALTGCAGEHFVAYRLSAMGYLVALTRGGSPSVDLMVGTADGKKTVTIQVKTANQAFFSYKKKPEDNYWDWRVSSKARELRGESVFYAFVNLNQGEGESSKSMPRPEVFIVPADDVAKNLNTYPETNPTSFWFDIMAKDKDRWHEAWRLIEERLA